MLKLKLKNKANLKYEWKLKKEKIYIINKKCNKLLTHCVVFVL